MSNQWVALTAVIACLQWTRISGTVKSVDLKESTVTIENREGDLLVVPIDFQVRIKEKKSDLVGLGLKDLSLDDKITLTRISADKPKDETEGLVPALPEPSQHGL